jgi:hypothetical protein
MKNVLIIALILTGICSAQVERTKETSDATTTATTPPTPIFTTYFSSTWNGVMTVNQVTGALTYCSGGTNWNATTGAVPDTGSCTKIAAFPPAAGASGNTLAGGFVAGGSFFVVNTVNGEVLECPIVNGGFYCASDGVAH